MRTFVESRANALAKRDDARIALDELLREPAAAIFARAHAGPKPTEEQALFRTVLLSLLISTAEACGGFDWDDRAFERAYAELERSLFGGARAYAAVAPLVGLSVVTQVELGGGIRLRAAATGELAHHWPEAQGLLPAGFGREVDRYCVLELERGSRARRGAARRPGRARRRRLRDPARDRRSGRRRPGALRAARLAAVRDPAGAADRRDAAAGRADAARLLPRRGRRASVLARLALADADAPLAEALDRWELSLFQNEPFRSEQLRGALAGLLGETWELRAAVLLGDASEERRAIHASLRSLAAGEQASERAEAAVRRSLVETLRHGDRATLVRSLDDALLGLRAAAGCVGGRRLHTLVTKP